DPARDRDHLDPERRRAAEHGLPDGPALDARRRLPGADRQAAGGLVHLELEPLRPRQRDRPARAGAGPRHAAPLLGRAEPRDPALSYLPPTACTSAMQCEQNWVAPC